MHFTGGYYSYWDHKHYIYIKDHQGNIRVVADINGNVVQRTNYDPFGMILPGSTNQERQPYKYNEKEFAHQDGLNLYNYGARWYDPARIQFTTMDPLAEKYYSISPYAYCKNNPVNRIDPDGRDDFFYNLKGDEINRIKTKELGFVHILYLHLSMIIRNNFISLQHGKAQREIRKNIAIFKRTTKTYCICC
jgi:RHS repeat-associated protein